VPVQLGNSGDLIITQKALHRHAVVQLVESLHCNAEGHGFNSQLCQCHFSSAMVFLLMFLMYIGLILLIGREKLFSVMSCTSWSDSPYMHVFMVYFLLLSIKIQSMKVIELLCILVGKYTMPNKVSSCFFFY
jgi:hypothetical protein